MVYREVHVVEIKEILTRVANGYSIRSVSNALGIHRDTIRHYLNLATEFGFVKDNCDSYKRKNITVRLPETDPGQYA